MKTDPLTGEQIPSVKIISYGDDIYDSPSKYDLIFWPLTEEIWICLNLKNGYAAFNDDFEALPESEKEGLTHWLKDNYTPNNPPKNHKEKLAWLEKVYTHRNMDDEFWCRFYRLMVYVHREDESTSMAYVRKAVPLLEKNLALNPEGLDKLEVLFLLGEYHRRLGDSKRAQEYFAQVKGVRYKDEDGKERSGHPYFVKLVKDRQKSWWRLW